MDLSFLGGAMEVGGSCIYVRTKEYGILLDCGIRQGKDVDPLPDFRAIQEAGGVDLILVSHSHMDHIGSLPLISRAYPAAPIYMTSLSLDVSRILLYDSLRLMELSEDELPQYAEKDVLNMLHQTVPAPFQTPIDLPGGIRVTFYPAGHIAGAACIYLETPEGSLFYSGDFSGFSQQMIEGLRVPKLKADACILESTYGDKLHAGRRSEEQRLIRVVGECLAAENKILIPAFAQGRAQEVLWLLRNAIRSGQIPSCPIYVDGMIRSINDAYLRGSSFLKSALRKQILREGTLFDCDEIRIVGKHLKRETVLDHKGPCIILSSSGMLSGGPSMLYASRLVSSEKACILITGYQDEEAPGRKLLELLNTANQDDRRITFGEVTCPVRCRIEKVGLSAHADSSEIESLADRIRSSHLFLVHGDPSSITTLSESLSRGRHGQIHLPACGETFRITDSVGRKTQGSALLSATLGRGEALTQNTVPDLYAFWMKQEKGRELDLYQAMYLWSGSNTKRSRIQTDAFRRELLMSGLFSLSGPTGSLLKPREKAAANSKTEAGPNLQHLEKNVRRLLDKYSETVLPPKKISVQVQDHLVSLKYDFPAAADTADFRAMADVFYKKTGWPLAISPAMNHAAARALVSALFGERVLKISVHEDASSYILSLVSNTPMDAQLAHEFETMTGWRLYTDKRQRRSDATAPVQALSKEALTFQPDPDTERMEMNQALKLLSEGLTACSTPPTKRKICSDHIGKYIELTFLSPRMGLQNAELLASLSRQICWRIQISQTYDTSRLSMILTELTQKAGIRLLKNPSWLASAKQFQIIPDPETEVLLLRDVLKDFEEKTGCSCRYQFPSGR